MGWETILLQAERSPSRAAKFFLAIHLLPSSAKPLVSINSSEQWIWKHFPYRANRAGVCSHISWQEIRQNAWFCSLAATKLCVRITEITIISRDPQLVWRSHWSISGPNHWTPYSALRAVSLALSQDQNFGDCFYPWLLASDKQTADIKGHTKKSSI